MASLSSVVDTRATAVASAQAWSYRGTDPEAAPCGVVTALVGAPGRRPRRRASLRLPACRTLTPIGLAGAPGLARLDHRSARPLSP